MTPESVGWKSNRMVLGKLSGRSAFRQRVRELAIPTKSETEIDEAFARFKDLADRKSEIFDEDIQSLFDTRNVVQQAIHFVSLKQSSETGQRPQAEVVYMDHGEERAATVRLMRLSEQLKAAPRAGQSCFFSRSTR